MVGPLVFYLYIVVLNNIYWPRGFCTYLKKKKNETQPTDHICLINLQLPVQSMQILNPAHGEAYSIQHYVIVCFFFPKPYLFFFAQNKNQNIFWHKKSVRLKWSVFTIMVHTNVGLFIILLSYKYYIISFSTPYLQCVISYCKCIQELFAKNNNTENTQDFIFSSPGHRPCELLSWVSVRRPSVRPLAFHI
jgi:hypothetical protein